MRIASYALVTAAVLCTATTASALGVRLSSKDCGTPSLSDTVGVTVQLAPTVFDPFPGLLDEQFIFQTGTSLEFCADASDLDANLTGIMLLFEPDELLAFEAAVDSLWSGLSYMDGLLTLFPGIGDPTLDFTGDFSDLSIEFLCDPNGNDELCNPFFLGDNVTVGAAITGFSTVPEPASIALLGTGLATLALRRRKRRR